MPRNRVKKTSMTQSTPNTKKPSKSQKKRRLGCFSNSEYDFLILNSTQKEEKYGKGKAKYYQRILESVQESFVDIATAYNYLPKQYSKKIDLSMGLDLIRESILKSSKENNVPEIVAELVLSDAISNLHTINTNLGYPDELTKLFSNSLDNAINWLVYLKKQQPFMKKSKE